MTTTENVSANTPGSTSPVSESTLADLVAGNAGAARVFERNGLDYCCHGDRTLAAAAAEAGIEVAPIAAELAALTPDQQPWTKLGLADLADHIVMTHHAYLHEELPLLDALADKVATVHGANHPELVEARRLVAEIKADLEPHLAREEAVLFPAIHALVDGRREFPFGSFDNPVKVLIGEHEATGELLEQLRKVTGNYALPADACASYTSLFQRLEALESDTHTHIHKENYVLFPGAIEMASEAPTTT